MSARGIKVTTPNRWRFAGLLGLLLCMASCGGGVATQPTPVAPAPGPGLPSPPRADLSGSRTGRVTDDAQALAGTMRLQWTLSSTRVLDGTWSWTASDQSLNATGSVRALELGDPLVAVFTLASPIRCATGESIPLFSAIVRVQDERLVGTVGGGGACGLRRFDLSRE